MFSYLTKLGVLDMREQSWFILNYPTKILRYSSMIEISSRAKTASRRCDEILSLDYFELMNAKQEVEKDVKNVLKLECRTTPCALTKLRCQFPQHERLLNDLRTCAKIVTGTNITVKNSQLHIEITSPHEILYTWLMKKRHLKFKFAISFVVLHEHS